MLSASQELAAGGSVAGMPTVCLIANPGSGSGGADDIGQLLAAAGADVVERVAVDHLADAEMTCDLVVAAGGDGTIGPVAERCGARGAPLAVVPVGTANDFAARLQLPDDPEAAVDLALRSEARRRLDLGFAGGRPFVNAVSFGLSPDAAQSADDLKDTLGALAYSVGAVQAGLTSDPIDCVVMCDEEEVFRGAAWQVMVGCTGAFGGGSQLDTEFDDGMLDVVVLEHGPRAQLVKFAVGLRSGGIATQKGVRSARGHAIVVTTSSVEQMNIDGELVELTTGQLDMRVVREAFELVVP